MIGIYNFAIIICYKKLIFFHWERKILLEKVNFYFFYKRSFCFHVNESVFPLRRRLDGRPTDWQFHRVRPTDWQFCIMGRHTRYTCAVDEWGFGNASGRLGGTSRPVGRSGADSLDGPLEWIPQKQQICWMGLLICHWVIKSVILPLSDK